MQIEILDSYESLSKKAADDVIQSLRSLKHPLFCVASGESPAGLYKELSGYHHQGMLDISHWYFLGLDEWMGLGKGDEGSCRNMLDRHLFRPLEVKEEQICFFDGKTIDPAGECQRVEEFIQRHGPIEVAVLGLGMNGHIGLNEPGTPSFLRSHVSEIDKMTEQVGQKYFTRPQPLARGITLGLATLMEAKRLILIVNGARKAAIVQQVLEEEATESLPATLLRDHPDFTIYLDNAAASLLPAAS